MVGLIPRLLHIIGGPHDFIDTQAVTYHRWASWFL
jgi:hypothetical protein